MHACWMAVTGWFFRAPPSLSLLSTLCFFPFLFLYPLFPARPPIDPPAPFTCLLSFSSGGERANKQNQQTAFLVHTCGYVFMFSQVGNNQILTCSPPFSQELSDMLLGEGGGVFFFFGLTVGVCDHVLDRQKQQSQGAGSRVIQPVMLFQKHPSPVLIRDFYARRILTQPGLLHRD